MWKCPKCGMLIEDEFPTCWDCNSSNNVATNGSNQQSFVEKYPALRIISGMYNFFAWLIAIAAVIGIFMVIDNNSREEGLLISLGIFIIGIIIFISLRAVAEVIKVFIDIEENTRKAADKK